MSKTNGFTTKMDKEHNGLYEPHRSEEFQPLTGGDVGVEDAGKQFIGQGKPVGVLQLFRFSDKIDRLFMILGLLCATLNGASLPVWMVLFGDMIDTFIGVGAFMNYLATIGSYLSARNITTLDVISNPTLYNCSDILEFYGGNISCFKDDLQDRLLDQMIVFAKYYCAIGGIVIVMAYGQIMFMMTAAERQAYRIRHACLRNVLRQDITWFDTHGISQLNTRLGDDVHRIQDGIGSKAANFWQWMSCSLFSLSVGFFYGWELSLVILASSPLLVVTAAVFNKLAAKISHKELTAYAQAGAIAEEVLGAIRTVVAFGGEEKEAQRYKSNLKAAEKFGIKKELSNGISIGFVWFSCFCMFGLGYWYGGKLFREDDDYGTSNVVIVTFSILIAAFALGTAAPSLQVIAISQAAASTIYDLIDCKPVIDSASTKGLKPSSVIGAIKFSDVYFNYPSRPDVQVLNGLNFEVPPGQTVAVVGASGCGKSTVVQLLLRFYDPEKGKIMIDGVDIRDLNIRWLRESIGLVSQEPVLFATTIAENIRYGREDLTEEDMEKACKQANAYDFIMKLPDKFETLVGERGAQLSGGQKQRLAIARALVRNPKILLLDEATSALDMESESIVQDALDKAREGRTTIVIAHRLSTIKTANIIVSVRGGAVVEMGTHSKLMKNRGFYYELVTHQHADASDEDEDEEDQVGEDTLRILSCCKIHSSTVTLDMEEFREEDLSQAPFSRILKFNAPEWPYIMLGCVGSIANGGIWPSYSIVFSRILKIFTYSDLDKQEEEMKTYTIMFLAIGFLSFFTYFIQYYMFGISGEGLTTRLRDKCFRAMLQQKMMYFDDPRNSVGSLTTRLATDTALVQGVTGHRLGSAIMSLSNVIMALVVAFLYGWKMTLVLLGLLPILVIGGVMQVRLMSGHTGKSKGALELAGKVTVESIGNIRTVASLNKEDKFLNLYMESLKEPYQKAIRNLQIVGLVFGISQGVMFFAYAIAFFFGALMIENGEMVLEDVFIVYNAVVFGSVGLGYASAFAPDLGKAQASARRILQIIDSVSEEDLARSQGEKLRVTGHRLGSAIMSLSNVIMALVVAFLYGWKMTLVLLGLLPILVIGGVMQVRLMSGHTGKSKGALELAGKVTVESIGNIRTVASLNKEDKFLNLYMESLKEPYQKAIRNLQIVGLVFGISQGVMFFAYAIAFFFGALMIENGEMVLEDVFIVYNAVVFGSVGLGYASAFAPDLGKAQASARRILQIIDSVSEEDLARSQGEKLREDYQPKITFNDVRFCYPLRRGVMVLKGLTFSVSPGQTVALVGPSGCGKSTTLQLIERFYYANSGRVDLGNTDVCHLDLKWLRQQIGIVSQEPVLFDRSIAQNIAYGDNSRTVLLSEVIKAAQKAHIHSFIESLPNGYETNVGPKGAQLSGGQKQRIAIARALVRHPKILMLDEATSALDTESEKIVQEALDKAREGRTCIVIAHRLSTVQSADNICVISHGKVAESGTHQSLIASQGYYSRLVKKSARDTPRRFKTPNFIFGNLF